MIRLLHAADLHLDSPFAGLRPDQAAARRKMQRQLPKRLADLCREHDCDLLLFAGDVFDGERVCPETVEALQKAFSQCPCPVCIAPGNHDPYTSASPWAAAKWPENVHIFKGPWESIDLPGFRVWGAAFPGREAHDLLKPVPAHALPQIAVLHGTADGEDSPYNPMTRAQIAASGLDYLALGHIHKTAPLRREGRTFYGWPGVAMGRGFDETGVHGAYLVELEGESCRASLLPLPGPVYRSREVPVGEDPEAAILEAFGRTDDVCRAILTGESKSLDLETIKERLKDAVPALELRDETVPQRAIWEECQGQSLRALALQTLKKQYDAAADGESRRALTLAARYVLAALEGREAP